MQQLDLIGLACPMPVLRVKKALAKMLPGERLLARTDDPHAVGDLALFAKQSGHTIVSQEADPQNPAVTIHVMQRKET